MTETSTAEAYRSALLALQQAFTDLARPAMIIGGLAAVARGIPRFTRDIDATMDAEKLDVDRALALSCQTRSGSSRAYRLQAGSGIVAAVTTAAAPDASTRIPAKHSRSKSIVAFARASASPTFCTTLPENTVLPSTSTVTG
jgi:hypothetical protein